MDKQTLCKFVEVNPRVTLQKSKIYPFVEMGVVEPERRYVRAGENRIFKGGGTKFMSGDTLFARITPCLENGKIAQYKDVDGNAAFGSTEFFIFRAIPGISDPGYVYYLANSEMIRKPAEKSMSGASGRQRADLKSIVDLDLPCPPLPVQRKIAAILSAYDDLIENNLRRIKILEAMAQNLYREWFVKFRFPGHQHTRFVDSPLGKIPEEWEVGTLGKTSYVIPGYAFKSKDWSDEGVPVIKIKNIRPGNFIDTEQADYVPEALSPSINKKYWLKSGDIMIAMTGATAGKIGKLRSKTTMFLNQRVAKIEPKLNFYEYVWCTVSSPYAEGRFYALADGSAQPNMSGGQIENYELLIPSTHLVQRFSDIVAPSVNEVDNLIFRNEVLRRTRDLLLPKLISGDVDVSELDIAVAEEVQ